MNNRWFAALSAALLCVGVSLSAGWLWQSMADGRYEANARMVLSHAGTEGEDPDDLEEDDRWAEARVLSPEVLSAAAALLQERSVPLSLSSPFDPVPDYLLSQVRVNRPDPGRPGEICIRSTAPDREEALQILRAVVDACLAEHASEVIGEARDGSSDEQFELDLERERLQQAINRQQQTIVDLAQLQQAENTNGDRTVDESAAALEQELGRIQQAHREATARLAGARRDIDNKLPAETVAARLDDVPARTRVLERLNQTKVRDELHRYEALQQKWSAVYGRNHPRMVEIRERIEALVERLGHAAAGEEAQYEDSDAVSPSAIVLAAFEGESTQLEQAEHEVLTRLSRVQERFQGQQELELKLGEARKELTFLQAEQDRTQKQFAAARQERSQGTSLVLSQPTLDREPLGPQAGLPMAVSCVAGMLLYLLLLRQIRSRWLASGSRESPAKTETTPVRRERFRSREEKQLMRLKMAVRG